MHFSVTNVGLLFFISKKHEVYICCFDTLWILKERKQIITSLMKIGNTNYMYIIIIENFKILCNCLQLLRVMGHQRLYQ